MSNILWVVIGIVIGILLLPLFIIALAGLGLAFLIVWALTPAALPIFLIVLGALLIAIGITAILHP